MKKYIGTKVIDAAPAWRINGKVYLKDEPLPNVKNSSIEDGYKVSMKAAMKAGLQMTYLKKLITKLKL